MLEAESRFQKVQGYRGIANIAVAIERDLTARRDSDHRTDKELTAALAV